VISSPLRRCHDFARHYVQQHVVYQHAGQQHAKRHKLRLRVEPRLREIHFGDWEGRSADDIEAADAAALKAFWHNPLVNMPPGSEPLADFHARVLAAWQELLQRYRGEHLLIVSHGGVIRLLLQHILAMPAEALLRVQVDHACLSRIAVHHHATPQAQLVFHGGRP
jgi:broad specificity phosphatase PhoE